MGRAADDPRRTQRTRRGRARCIAPLRVGGSAGRRRGGHFFSGRGIARSSQMCAAVREAISVWRGTAARRLPFA